MRLRPGIDPNQAAQKIGSLLMVGGNFSVGQDLVGDRDAFVAWIAEVERLFREIFLDVRIERLHTRRYWSVQTDLGAVGRPIELMRYEIEAQVAYLERLKQALLALATRLSHGAAVILVPDTNALLHFRLFNEVDWHEVVGAPSALLAVPLRVVDELDLRKSSRDGLAKRAKTVISHLRAALGDASGTPVPIRDNVWLQVVLPVDIDGRLEPQPDGDTEILDTAESLSFTTKRIVVVTGDYGMQIRAGTRGVEAVPMPDRLASPLADPDSR